MGVDVILRPFFEVLMRSKNRVLLGKLKSCVFDELVKLGKEILLKKRMGVDYDEKDGDGNRKLSIGLHEGFLKLENELESPGIEIAIPEHSDVVGGADDDDEVPQLIPVEYNTGNCTAELGSQEGANDVHENEDRSDDRSLKKQKEVEKGVDRDDKKAKKKKKNKLKRKDEKGASDLNTKSFTARGNSLIDDPESDGSAAALNGSVISNLQKQFVKVATEAGSYSGEDLDSSDTPLISVKANRMLTNKRKKAKTADMVESGNMDTDGAEMLKLLPLQRIRRRKPQNPLPRESLRLPPSLTPRGSALQKWGPPGPIIETQSVKKKMKPKKKAKKRLSGATSMMLLRKRIQTQSVLLQTNWKEAVVFCGITATKVFVELVYI
ncbi:uncharacterized protein LOC105155897 [Sesamum indicum]|uniref:Uncharacterized protein LOC105155897 n=1 Tax=Sesamum indicum TaxID=4182 RepID=A0A6I9SM77_SESIN|nr:uncharacterized protein LOC105155897 [Sesamum indicum]